MQRLLTLLLMGTLAITMAKMATAQLCTRNCSRDVRCELEVAECLIKNDQVRDAIQRIKDGREDFPENPSLSLMLAKAYLADGNLSWAQRTLSSASMQHPSNCIIRSWLAWTGIVQGDFSYARDVLDEPGCPSTSAEQSRWHLLEGYIASSTDNQDAITKALTGVQQSEEVFPGDAALWRHLHGKTYPGWIDPVNLRVEIDAGYTSNARAGSPVDPASDSSSSGVGRLSFLGRFVAPLSSKVRPVLEVGIKSFGITSEESRELSYIEFSSRPGLLFGDDYPRLFIGYKPELLLLNQKDKRVFLEGHRAEVDVEWSRLSVFFGTGRKLFAESGRTRWEIDGGVGGGWPIGDRWRLLLGLSGRYYDAYGDAYSLFGASFLAMASVLLFDDIQLRAGVTSALDYYFDSGGHKGVIAHGIEDKRFDRLYKVNTQLLSPAFAGFRVGASYEYSIRNSSAAEQDQNFEYSEHRLLAKMVWRTRVNTHVPKQIANRHNVELDYGLSATGSAGLADEDRIHDLLRQDEAVRSGSSCAE